MKFSCPLFFFSKECDQVALTFHPFYNLLQIVKTFHINWILMKLNKYQNDTQIPLALFLQVLVLHLVHNCLFIRILKDLSLLKSFHKISGIRFKWPLLRDIPELMSYLHCRLCLCFILFNASHYEQLKTSKSMKMAGSYGPPP
jgi:hypothetical protein